MQKGVVTYLQGVMLVSKAGQPSESWDQWNQNHTLAVELAILDHVMFPKTHEIIDLSLLEPREHIERGHVFIHALIAEKFRTLGIIKTTGAKNLECCVALLQIWFLEHITLCLPLVTKGFSKKT